MRKFNVTVNGVSYEVEIEEVGGNSTQNITYTAPSAPPTPTVSASPQPQVQTPSPAQPTKSTASGTGQKVIAPMPGKIMTIYFSEGQAVKKGEPIVILEAMKMQNELLSPCDGIVQVLNVTEGQNVKSSEVIMVVG